MAVETAKKQGSIKPRRMKTPKPFKKRIEPWLWLMPALVFFLMAEKRIVGGLTGAVKG